MPLNKEEYEFYDRQLILPEFGEASQLKLKQAKVLVVGAGGLGCPVLQYLTAAGVGTIGIADDDVVSISNLHRQVLFSMDDAGKLKAVIAQEKLQRLNPNVGFDVYAEKITTQNSIEIISGYDIVVDGTDNFPAKYLLNDACVIAGKILVYGSILRYEGQVSVFNHQLKINYRDLFPKPPSNVPNCAEAGVLGSLCGIIGSIQANEVIKLIAGNGEVLDGKLLCYNAQKNGIEIFKLKRDPLQKAITKLIDYDIFCGLKDAEIKEISEAELQEMKAANVEFQLIDVREPWEKELEDQKGGLLIPLAEIENHLDQIARDKKVVFYCRSGSRSRQAILKLQKRGFNNLFNLAG